jgi:hypothetical protein
MLTTKKCSVPLLGPIINLFRWRLPLTRLRLGRSFGVWRQAQSDRPFYSQPGSRRAFVHVDSRQLEEGERHAKTKLHRQGPHAHHQKMLCPFACRPKNALSLCLPLASWRRANGTQKPNYTARGRLFPTKKCSVPLLAHLLDLPPANPMTSGRSGRAVSVVKSRNFRWASQRDSARVRRNETDQRRHRLSPGYARLARQASAHPGLHRFANFEAFGIARIGLVLSMNLRRKASVVLPPSCVTDRRSGQRRLSRYCLCRNGAALVTAYLATALNFME